MKILSKAHLTEWTIQEIIDNAETQNPDKGLYEQEGVDNFLENVASELGKALEEIRYIQGIDNIDNCKKIILKAISMLF